MSEPNVPESPEPQRELEPYDVVITVVIPIKAVSQDAADQTARMFARELEQGELDALRTIEAKAHKKIAPPSASPTRV